MKDTYRVKIESSFFDIDKYDSLRIKQEQGVLRLKDVASTGECVIEGIANIHVLQVHNEMAENTDYTLYVLETHETSYSTSSESFYTSVLEVFETFAEEIEAGEKIDIKVRKQESKNNEGSFFTATITR